MVISISQYEAAPASQTAIVRIIGPNDFKVLSADNEDMKRTLATRKEEVEESLSSGVNKEQFLLNIIIKLKKYFGSVIANDKKLQTSISDMSNENSMQNILIKRDAIRAYCEQQLLIEKLKENKIPVFFMISDRNTQSELFPKEIKTKNDGSKVEVSPYHPDQIFVTDTGKYFYVNEKLFFAPACFFNPARKDEQRLAEEQARNFGAEIIDLGGKIFEGGDLRLAFERKVIFMGYGHRAEFGAAAAIEKTLDGQYQIFKIKLLLKQFYHLDCCFLPLPNGYAVVYEGEYELCKNGHTFFEADGYPKIKDGTATMDIESRGIIRKLYGEKLITISQKEALDFATNAAVFKNTLGKYVMLVNEGSFTYANQKKIVNAGISIVQTPYGTIHSSGGSVRCTINEMPVSRQEIMQLKAKAAISKTHRRHSISDVDIPNQPTSKLATILT